jgi:predicted tellurium resistance membrane protein TerC
MRIFLIVLAVSIGLSILLWNFGLAQKVWPAHPLLLTTLFAMVCAIAVQTILRRDEAESGNK